MAWRDKAEAELAHLSGRRSRGDELTEAEKRVAQQAAEGRHNKEIASTLFLSVGTVEMHLSHVYRKLGVRSRTELAGHLLLPRRRSETARLPTWDGVWWAIVSLTTVRHTAAPCGPRTSTFPWQPSASTAPGCLVTKVRRN